MRELKKFIKGLKRLGFEAVAISEVFGDESAELVNVDDLLVRIRECDVKVVAEYYESLELIIDDEKYIEINGVY